MALVREEALSAGAFEAAVSNHWSLGGKGAVDLAEAVRKACNQPSNFRFLYDLEVSSRNNSVFFCCLLQVVS